MPRRSAFLDVVLRGAGPTLELLGAFAIGLLVVGVLSNLAYDLLVHPPVGVWAIVRALVAVAVLMAVAYFFYRLDRRRQRILRANVDETRLARPCAGLVWILGPGSFDHLMVALRHHQEHKGAQHCWLVMQRDNKDVLNAYTNLQQQVAEMEIRTLLHPQYLSDLDVRAGYEAVTTILEREVLELGLTPNQVVCDITGGTKPLTIGMVLASLANNSSLEYVETDRDEEGRPVPNTARVVAVDISFYLEQAARDQAGEGG
ncbi:MAG: hypothetical protein KatS3mg050_1263 [Litorilinea sp.]|nr:MAG: hypothetical protein KatS3mg050_1263 [Litorilinea sp.]